ncbi:MAG: CCA tRNA nucleotidyltransferase [Verrucomicrobiaceae bacterium]|nr:CCA tRNA nucleotidyltransferase [Verrucomicrobiaceae bacterium]
MEQKEKAAILIVRTLQENGFTAYFAGGCVRDSIRGETPIDYDIATSAHPEEVENLFPKTRAVGSHFGVILVFKGEYEFEVATFRNEGTYSDGRRPDSVEFSTAIRDAARRDFTVNGLFKDPLTGEIIDHVEGQADITNGVIRAIGDPHQRFSEDHLRLLRAIRFSARLGYRIEPNTLAALKKGAEGNELEKISAERIRDEFSMMMLDHTRTEAFDLLVETGLMKCIIPEILALKGCEQPPQFHPEGDVFVHTRLMLQEFGKLEHDPEINLLHLVLSILLHDIAKPETFSYDEDAKRIRFNGHDKVGAEMATDILRRLKYPNSVIEAVNAMVENHMAFKDVQHMRVAKLKRFMDRPTYHDEMELHRIDCLCSWGGLDNHEFLIAKQEEFANEPIIPPPLLSGHDLIERGIESGPRIGAILHTLQDLQLEGTVPGRDAALEWLEGHLKALEDD